jgi:hypothetical protein
MDFLVERGYVVKIGIIGREQFINKRRSNVCANLKQV